MILGEFLDLVIQRGVQLYPAQEEAVLQLYDDKNVILNTPTGSGKSLVASALHFKSLRQSVRSVYTCPIKALVNEKWLSLCKEFGPDNVGLSTGDATVNRNAPILCCTAEILANMALRDGADSDVRDVVMDEFHYYSDRDRGVAWQVPLLTMERTRFLLMSATLGETTFFETALTRLNGRETITVRSQNRPVPLEFSYAETPLAQTVGGLLEHGQGPVYVVHFSQGEAAQSAQDFMSLPVSTKDEKAAIADALSGFRFSSPYGPEVKKWLRHGIGLHHAGLLPKYRVLVEQLAQRGLLKVICGTDTLGVGINVPIRTVLFTQLCKYSGQKTSILTARDFHQISGRAGRKGFDSVGWVIAQAPAHAIENLLLEQKQASTGKKFVRRKPPEKNFVNWDASTFTRLIGAAPERLSSQFQVSHGMLLNVLGRPGDGCAAMRELIDRCHESAASKKALRKRSWQLFRPLVERGIIQIKKSGTTGPKLRVNVELQQDFSMNQTLSLYLLDTIPKIDPETPEYPLVLLTLVESILEDPDLILRKQLDRVKSEALAEMKADGLEYHERMEELEKLEYPKPHREMIYATFNAFAAEHPWVGDANIRPKSIAREMFEEFRSFSDYIKRYELERAEGLLLRHLTGVYKVLAQTVPDKAKTPPVREMELYLSEMLRQVDSSLLDEWERMRNPDAAPKDERPEVRPPGAEEAAADITRDRRTFLATIRTRIFTFLRAMETDQFETALAVLTPVDGETVWTVESLADAMDAYRAEHERLRVDPEARNIRHTHVLELREEPDRLRIQQMLIDPDEANDWVAEFDVLLTSSRERKEPVLLLRRFESLV